MRSYQVITIGLLLAAAGCGDRGGIGLGNDDAGANGGQGGKGQGGNGQGGSGQGGSGQGGAGGGGCASPVCNAACVAGYVHATDANGCCTCVPACPDTGCTLACPNGYQTDANGCGICACKPPPICRPLVCPAIACPNGQATDAQGCPTCGCRTTCGSTSACFLYCQYGFQHDASGCQVCACNTGECTAAECNGGVAGGGSGSGAAYPAPACPGGPPISSCQRSPDGVCRWVTQCPGLCTGGHDPATCGGMPGCVWIEAGCRAPALGTGCYERTLLDCAARGGQCPAGKTCQQRSTRFCVGNTVPPPLAGVAADQPGGADRIAPPADPVAPCQSCPAPLSICL
jgi:hypothetical protein